MNLSGKPLAKTERFIGFDYLRGIAVILVFLSHIPVLDSMPYWFKRVSETGSCGVQLFFIISAFVLMHSTTKRFSLEHHRIKIYYFRRFMRIAPLYYFCLLYFTFFPSLFSQGWDNISSYSTALLLNILFLHDLSPIHINSIMPGWTIGVEMTFSLFLPIIIFYIKSIKSATVLFIGSIFFYLFLSNRYVYYLGQLFNLESYSVFRIYTNLWIGKNTLLFSSGILLYFIVNSNLTFFKNKSLFISSSSLAISVTLYILHILKFFNSKLLYLHYTFIFFFLVLGVYLFPRKLVAQKILCTLGKCCFSMYLIQFAVFEIFHTDLTAMTDHLFLYYSTAFGIFFLTFLLSYFSFNMIEKKFIKLGEHLINKLS